MTVLTHVSLGERDTANNRGEEADERVERGCHGTWMYREEEEQFEEQEGV